MIWIITRVVWPAIMLPKTVQTIQQCSHICWTPISTVQVLTIGKVVGLLKGYMVKILKNGKQNELVHHVNPTDPFNFRWSQLQVVGRMSEWANERMSEWTKTGNYACIEITSFWTGPCLVEPHEVIGWHFLMDWHETWLLSHSRPRAQNSII